MRETKAALGGEMSGHIFFADRYFGYDDAIYAGARLLEIIANGSGSVEDMLADLPPSFTTPEIRVDCPDDIKFAVVERAVEHFRKTHEIVDIDGVRVKLVGRLGPDPGLQHPARSGPSLRGSVGRESQRNTRRISRTWSRNCAPSSNSARARTGRLDGHPAPLGPRRISLPAVGVVW